MIVSIVILILFLFLCYHIISRIRIVPARHVMILNTRILPPGINFIFPTEKVIPFVMNQTLYKQIPLFKRRFPLEFSTKKFHAKTSIVYKITDPKTAAYYEGERDDFKNLCLKTLKDTIQKNKDEWIEDAMKELSEKTEEFGLTCVTILVHEFEEIIPPPNRSMKRWEAWRNAGFNNDQIAKMESALIMRGGNEMYPPLVKK